MGIGSDAKGFGYITCPGAVRKDDRELVGIVHRRGPVRTVPEYMETKLSNIVEPTFDDVRTNWLARVSEAAHALAATHVQEQSGADTSRSSLSIGATIPINRVPLVSDRDRWLDPPPARSWQLRSKSTLDLPRTQLAESTAGRDASIDEHPLAAGRFLDCNCANALRQPDGGPRFGPNNSNAMPAMPPNTAVANRISTITPLPSCRARSCLGSQCPGWIASLR
jgi:hypothetical protein